MGHRKPTKKEALAKLKELPDFEKPSKVTSLPAPLRPIAVIPYVFDQGGKAIARLLIRGNVGGRIDNSNLNQQAAGEIPWTGQIIDNRPGAITPAMVNDPNVVMDEVGNVLELIEPLRDAGGFALPSKKSVKRVQKVTKKMKATRKIQSKAFKNANAKGRKKNGQLKKGWSQSRIATSAQKECTKERQRLGLCDKPKKKSRKKMK